MIWLSVICVLIFIASSVLAVKIYLIKKDIASIDAEFYEILNGDTNGLITIDGRDKSVRRLAANLNLRLKELRSLRLKYEHGDLELKNAVANVSHDLRTPLTAIIGYLELLEKEKMSADAKRYTRIIVNRIETLKQLAEELFRYSVVTSPDYDSPKERLCVNAVLEECIAAHYSSLVKAGITPQIIMPEIPVYRVVNRVALTRIFSNLLGNAIKYSDGDLSITLTKECEISFSNTATKLTEVQVHRLFDRFYTVENARESTGLGLSISRVLAEKSGGEISAEYADEILTVTVSLPSAETD